MKNFNNFILFLVLNIICFLNCFAQKDLENTLLWRISGNGLAKSSYLYGTIHIKDPKVFNFSDSVLIAFNSSDIVAQELNMDSMYSKMIEYLPQTGILGALNDRGNYDTLYTKEEIDTIDKKLKAKLGFGFDKFKTKNPWLIFVALNYKKPDSSEKNMVVDTYFYMLAKLQSKTVVGLEQVDEQTRFMKNCSPKQMKNYIFSAYGDKFQEGMDTLKENYEEEDLNIIAKRTLKYVHKNAFIHDFIIGRNVNMCNRAIPLIQKSPTFIAVGAAHLPGDSGLISLFKLKGYKVEPVKRVYTGYAKNYKTKTDIMPWYDYTNKQFCYSVEFPCQPYGECSRYMLDKESGFDWTNNVTYSVLVNFDKDNSMNSPKDFVRSLKKQAPKADLAIIDSTKVTLKHNAAYWKINYKCNRKYYSSYIVKLNSQMFYLLQSESDKEINKSDSERFFKSFNIKFSQKRVK